MKICMLNGHLILREHKTGVHYFHEIVTHKLSNIANKSKDYTLKVAFFDNKGVHTHYMQEHCEWMEPLAVISKAPRILSYILPIEFFFGENDVYFCDGLFPITMHHSKRVCLVHDLMVDIYPENYSAVKKVYLKYFFKHLIKADLVFAVSETTKKDIIKYYGVNPDKIIVCYNGVEKDNSSYKTSYIPANSRIDYSKKYLLYVGDMRKNKNLPNTVKGYIEFCKRNKTNYLYFYIAGKESGEYETVKTIAGEAGYSDKVVFLGYVSDEEKDFLYQNCLAVVLLSYYEGFGMPIIEGMKYYKPVITSNCSSMKEIAEGAALLADPNDTTDIADAIYKVYSGQFTVDVNLYNEKLAVYSFDNVAKIIDTGLRKLINE